MSNNTTTRREFLKKSALVGAAVAAGTEVLAPAAEAAAPATHSDATYTLEYWDWWSPVGSPAYTRWFDWVKKTFESENPGVTLKYQFLPWGDPYLQKIQAAVAAGSPPDVFHTSVAWARDLWDRNVLYKMNDLIAVTPQVQPNQFFPSAAYTDSESGNIFGVPMEGPDSDIIMMNVDYIAKTLGWPAATPQDIWAWPDKIQTWDDFNKLAVALTKRSGDKLAVAGFNVPDVQYIEGLSACLWANGSSFYNKDMSSVNINTPHAAEYLQWMLDLQNKYKVSQPLNAQRDDLTELLTNRAAMIWAGTWSPSYLHDSNPKFRLMMMPIPRGPHGKRKGTTTWNNMVCMARNVKNANLAWKFVKFISAPSTQTQRLAILERYAPLRSFFTTPQWKAETLKDPALYTVPIAAAVGGPYPFFHSSELQDKIGPILSEIWLGKTSMSAGLAKAQQVGDSILSGV
jgi:multiple sugar transport system substrate-binding protein